MFENIKIDIIYYKTNADFELEFNLCGCCRMRLLTDKAPDKKTLINLLSRAVSRSRVIIIAGDLAGENGITNIVSNAISKPVSEIDNSIYGILSDKNQSVINGATPLVTPDGDFGGCIIESGPQSMILLSDNKAIRKTIMNTLIHPYVEELCALDLKAKAAAVTEMPEQTIQESPNTSDDTEPLPDNNDLNETEPAKAEIQPVDNQDDSAVSESDSSINNVCEPTTTEYPDNKPDNDIAENVLNDLNFTSVAETAAKNDGVDLSGGMIFETDEYRASAQQKTLTREQSDTDKKLSEYSDTSEDNNFDEEIDKQSTNKALNLPILILSLFLLLLLAVLSYCIFYIPTSKGISPTVYLQETMSSLFG